ASAGVDDAAAARHLGALEVVRDDVGVDAAVAADCRAGRDPCPLANHRYAGVEVARLAPVRRVVVADADPRARADLALLVDHAAVDAGALADDRVVHDHRVLDDRAAVDAHARRQHAVDHGALHHAAVREQAVVDLAGRLDAGRRPLL